MSSAATISSLLIEAPVGRHFAQIHRHMEGLVASARLFMETGLRRGHGLVVFASDSHTEQFLQCLTTSGVDPESARRSGQLVIRNARETLRQFMDGDMPDWTRFRQTIGATLESVHANGRTGIRAYAEMVDILWREGRAQAAIRVEEYWNEIATIYPLSLFCGYLLDHHDHSTYRSPLREIGRTHTEVLSTDEDERFGAALDAASRDVFGVPLNNMLRLSHLENYPGEERLPGAQRTMLWIMRHLPSTSGEVLKKARKYLAAGR